MDKKEVGPFAGNGREDIVDGPLLPPNPFELAHSSFAQPSGLTSDGNELFVADSEGSSIRTLPLDGQGEVETLVGTSRLPHNRLFSFGDKDGPTRNALLQHVLGVAYSDGVVYVADTYNNKIKAIDITKRTVRTIAGTGEAGKDDEAATFDEPAGLSIAGRMLYIADTNNHLIRTINLEVGTVETLVINGLAPPKPPTTTTTTMNGTKRRPSFPGAKRVTIAKQTVSAKDGLLSLRCELNWPEGWKVNPNAPMGLLVESIGENSPFDDSALGDYQKIKNPKDVVELTLSVNSPGRGRLQVSCNYYYCQTTDEGLCKTGSVVWNVELEITENSDHPNTLTLNYDVPN